MKRQLHLALLLVGAALVLIPFTVLLKASAGISGSRVASPVLPHLGDRVIVHAQGRGAPGINLTDGHEVLTAYAGNPDAQRMLQGSLVQPLAMASSDFDEDGTPDLVSGYAAPNGGILTLHRGNVDAIYPDTLEAQQRKVGGTFTDAPFLSPARAFETSRPVDFLGCGDFDADGHWDVVTAARGLGGLHFFLGDGHGNLSAARLLELSGTVTALATGEINRADGLTDVVVGLAAATGSQALVFESPEGALKANPETFPLRSVATAIALGRLDEDYTSDLVVAAGSDLMVVYGRDRRLSLDQTAQRAVLPSRISRRSLTFAVRSVAIGDFKGDQMTGLSLLTDQGNVHLLSPTPVKTKEKKKTNRIEKWKDEMLSAGYWPLATAMVSARVASVPSDSLVIVDSGSAELHILATSAATSVATRQQKAIGLHSVSLDVQGMPVAVLPMRLNADALSDLVILRKGGVAPSVAITSPATIFTVSSAADSGVGTLREAITLANGMPGPHTINFSIGSGAQTISLLSALPQIVEAVTIDGTTQPEFMGTPLIELDGSLCPPGTNGLFISDGGASTVRGLVINRFSGSGYGIRLQNFGGNIVEGNYIGTNLNGNAALPNGRGIFINLTPDNQIGGTTAAARNVISGNTGNGVDIQGTTALGNTVQGNFIGTNAAGTAGLGNGGFGISVQLQAIATIGGTNAGAGNVISANGIGIGFGAAAGSLVQGNFIGTDVNGVGDLGNNQMGVQVTTVSPNNTFGGTTVAARNIVSGNNINGFQIRQTGTDGNIVQGNFIGTQANGVSPLGNGLNGVSIENSANNNSVGGPSVGAGNVIAFNGRNGVAISGGTGNLIGANSIFSNTRLGIDLNDDILVTPNDNCDSDLGANQLQNFPVLTSASSSGGNTTIVGTLNSASLTTFTIEFFSSSACDPSGNGEGQSFIGATTVPTSNSCVASINATFPVAVPAGSVITATATDPLNNTSEFSQCFTVAGGGPVSDLQITKSDSPDPVVSGANITYTIVVINNGPDTDLGATFTDIIPVGTTFVSLTSPGSCSTPPVGATGTVTCSLGALPPGGSAAITLVVNVNAAPGGTITNTATISGTSSDPNPINNSATAFTDVNPGKGCFLSCPSDLFLATSSSTSTCGTVVNYAPVSSGCSTVTCTPPSGSVFAVGSTTVNCAVEDGPSCSFDVTVVDETPPSITCVTGVSATLAGQLSAVVNYPAPTATDNCSIPTVTCVPPSGSNFPPGSTLVTCTARDGFGNISRCFFFVNVFDGQPPVITCPGNVSVLPQTGQTSAVVNYPAPTVADNLPGVTVSCLPPSGSSFPLGSTTVTCTATDAGGNRASCSFTVGVGAAQARVTIPGNKTVLEFTADPKRKPPKPKNNPCVFFTIDNVGFAPLSLTFVSLRRTGSDVTSGRITDPNDVNNAPENTPRFFTLFRVNADQSLTQLSTGQALAPLQPGQGQLFCTKFAALIPGLAGKSTGLSAPDVLPNVLTSTITFVTSAGSSVEIPISARVSTGVELVNLTNRRAAPEVLFTRSGDEITVSYGVFDSNLDVTRAKYEFLNSSGQVVAGPFEIDLAGSISSANLVRGQSFRVDQRFTGGNSNPDATSVRVTVFDGETSASSLSIASLFYGLSFSTSYGVPAFLWAPTLYPPTGSLR
ncbi:MAG TPA: HYR domain-containing protein [Blastocatellia bacterium]|nr:HYR domain-containing protein [Blastocatellia bacterium]